MNARPTSSQVLALVLALLVLAAGTVPLATPAAAAAPDAQDEAADLLRGAQRVQRTTRDTLRVFGGGNSCDGARFVAYKRSNREPDTVDQWYVVSQLWADATLLSADPSRVKGATVRQNSRGQRIPAWDEDDARCHVDKGFVFLDRLWDQDDGGYYPRSNASGNKVTRQSQFADDNALAGLALLAAADAADDNFSRDYYVYAAIQEAEYLTESGLWDDTFGGGFWWSTGRGDSDEGKPAQSNALAALFFARLYAVTGDPTYRDRAFVTITWLDGHLFDNSRNLYRWSVRYQRPSERAGGEVRSDRYFNYDQSIAIEAQLLIGTMDGNPERAARAKAMGEAIHAAFWNREKGGYNLEAGVEQVYTSYAAWTSFGHLALHAVDGQSKWLQMVRANGLALATTAVEADGGYALRYFRCLDPNLAACAGGNRGKTVVDRTRDTAAQAWAQHLQTALARRLVARRP
ncbi:MAG: hypothetical protein IT306_12460 [Chloroflexi bacterium]|nr:hypothetical protein [Chloroflexota bacterium]